MANNPFTSIDYSKLGKTPTGRAWLEKAIHPPGKSTVAVTGMPDNEAFPSTVLEFRNTVTIRPPNMGANKTWSLVMLTLPSPETPAIYWAWPDVTPTQYPTLAQGAVVGNQNYSFVNWSRDIARWRMLYGSVTSELNAPALSNQGMVYCAQQRLEMTPIAPMTGTSERAIIYTSLTSGTGPGYPTSPQLLQQLSPGFYKQHAREGVFSVSGLVQPTNFYQPGVDTAWYMTDTQTNIETMLAHDLFVEVSKDIKKAVLDSSEPEYTDKTAEEQAKKKRIPRHAIPGDKYSPIICDDEEMQSDDPKTQQPQGDQNRIVNINNRLNGAGVGVTAGITNNWSSSWIMYTGIDASATLEFKFIHAYEVQAALASSMTLFVTPSAEPDNDAVLAYYALRHGMQDGYPAAYNFFGTLLAGLSSLVPRIVDWLKPVASGALSGAMGALSGQSAATAQQLPIQRAPPIPKPRTDPAIQRLRQLESKMANLEVLPRAPAIRRAPRRKRPAVAVRPQAAPPRGRRRVGRLPS